TLQLDTAGHSVGTSSSSRLEINASQLQVITTGNGNNAYVVDTAGGLAVTNSSLGTSSTFDLRVEGGNLTSVVDGIGDLRADNVVVEVTGATSTIGKLISGVINPLEIDASVLTTATSAGGSI